MGPGEVTWLILIGWISCYIGQVSDFEVFDSPVYSVPEVLIYIRYHKTFILLILLNFL